MPEKHFVAIHYWVIDFKGKWEFLSFNLNAWPNLDLKEVHSMDVSAKSTLR